MNDPEPPPFEPTPSPTPSAPPPPQFPAITATSQDEKTLAIVMHVLGLVGFPIIGPLVIWLMKKDISAYLDAQGRELMNFQVSVLIYAMVSALLCIILIGFPMLFVVGVGSLIFTIIGLVKASDGLIYRFPYILRFF